MFGLNLENKKKIMHLKAVYRMKNHLKWLKIKCRSSEL